MQLVSRRRRQDVTGQEEDVTSHIPNMLPPPLSAGPDVPDGGPERASVLHGQVRRRAAEVDSLAVGGSRGQHHRGAAETGVGTALPAHQLAALHLDLDL